MNLKVNNVVYIAAVLTLGISGQGSAQLTPASGSPHAVGTYPISLAVGDFHEDTLTKATGYRDLAVVNNGSNNVSILLGEGGGTFSGPVTVSLPAGSTGPRAIAAGAFTGDGWTDLVVADSTGIVVLLNKQTATPSFSGTAYTAAGFGFSSPEGIGVGDFNGDGCLDIAVTNFGSNTVSIVLNTKNKTTGACTGTFIANNPATFAAGSGPSGIAVADLFDQCAANSIVSSPPTPCAAGGELDLAVVNSLAGTVTLLTGTGPTGTTITPPSPGAPLSAAGFVTISPSISLSSGTARTLDEALSIAVGDFNGDGFLDIVVAVDVDTVAPADNGGPVVLLNDVPTPGSFGVPVWYPADQIPASVALGDFNGDGIIDLVVANAFSDDISVLFGHGNGSFQPPSVFPLDYSVGVLPTAVVTFNILGGLALPPNVAVANFGSDNVSVFTGM